jgi:hypothetical protein
MGILFWDKPKKKLSKAEWEESYGFEDGPTGGYVPNMSDEDAARWKAKITGQKLGFPQVEIRKTAGSQMTIIVNLGEGYNYKQYRARDEKYPHPMTKAKWCEIHPEYAKYANGDDAYYRRIGAPTEGINVHIALNGPAQLTFEEMDELHQAIQEAKAVLEKLGTGE